MIRCVVALICSLAISIPSFSQTVIVNYGSNWKFLDNGSNQGTVWTGASFNDVSWASGNAELGYSDSPATTISYGPDANNKFITYYFRKVVNFPNPNSYSSVTLNLRRDDGAVVYINGSEFFRSNMPSGTVSYSTLASSAASDDGDDIQTTSIPISAFVSGNNTIAVEIHQSGGGSSDLTFDLQLVTSAPVGNQPPVANAGADQIITLPTSSTTLLGSGTDDGSIASYTWSQTSGPNTATFTSKTIAQPTVSGLIAGTYVFSLVVTDNTGNSSPADAVSITVNAASNQPPVANAGADQIITLPASSTTLLGSGTDDGSIGSYIWTQTSGPNTATFTSKTIAQPTVSGLIAGTYVFSLVVTDNTGNPSPADAVNITVNAQAAALTLVPYGSPWKYLDKGSNQGTAWTGVSFNDVSWTSGNAELGYNDNPTTAISYGPDANNKFITYYFRKVVNFPNPSSYSSVTLNLRRDDGAVVYINGTEFFRSNMPSGAVGYTTLASSGASDDGDGIQTTTIPISAFVSGNNTIAVEIHQSGGSSSDLTFDLQLVTSAPVGNQPPVANAGADQIITLPASSTTLLGSGTDDGSIASYTWSQTSGPNSATFTSKTIAQPTVSGLIAGAYVFSLVVTDNTGNPSPADAVSITVNAASNQPPVANAGADQIITLPASSTTLLGSGTDDGSIASYIWAQTSGPNTATFTSKTIAQPTVSGLIAGTYVFSLVVTDNTGNPSPADAVNITVNAQAAALTLIPYGSPWKYLDNGSNQGTAWTGVSFNDASWTSGNAELGYSDNPATAISYGSDANNKFITYYFRKVVNFPNPSSYSSVTLNLRRDDGAVVYINGTEVFRSNMPSGNIGYTTLASSGASDDGDGIQTTTIPISAFVSGNNTIAVEIHQSGGSSSDLTFDLQLVTSAPVGNQPPVANAGADQIITSPASSATLLGSGTDDGSIASYTWSQASGPNTAAFTSKTIAQPTVSGLIAGTYVFSLVVTDNTGNPSPADAVSVTVNAQAAALTLIPYGSPWKYLDNGSNQGSAWTGVSFNDASWASGNAELGYSDNPATAISYGPDANNKFITYYFRKVVNFSNPSSYSSVTLNLRRDDGAVVYINGTEFFRSNMPSGAVSYSTLASSAASDDGDGIQTTSIPVSAFVSGNNTIAVEIHQSAANSSDLTFDLELVTNGSTLSVTRAPYLQMTSSTATTIKWRTASPSDSKIEVGTAYGSYTLSATNSSVTTEHEVRISGLIADTKYFYRIGSTSSIIQTTVDNNFITAPLSSSSRKIRVAVFGDCGNGSSSQVESLSAYQQYVGSNPAELMLLLGDNAYSNGTDAEYQQNFFNVYSGNILRNHSIFPTPGNHEYANNSERQLDKDIAYYSIFSSPQNAECGGIPSNSESYYSYDWGNIHFISLDSYGMESSNGMRLYDTTSTQVTWLKQDLAANTKKWTIAYWHHPPYSMGNHNSDNENELVKIRENLIRILERNGVDMIMTGHSHDYERSYLLKGYFGNEGSFSTAAHTVTTSSGKYDGTSNSCAYQSTSAHSNHGTVYVVSGSAGSAGPIQAGYPHNAMPFSFNDGGMFYFEVEGNRLDAKFIRMDGVIADNFTIMKDVGKTQNLTVSNGGSISLTASWIGTYQWSNGSKSRTITVTPQSNTTYSCSDGSGCITDQFIVTVNGSGSARMSQELSTEKVNESFTVYPVPVDRGTLLNITTGSELPVELLMHSVNGQEVFNAKVQGSIQVNTEHLAPGLYIIRQARGGSSEMKRIMITDKP